MSINLTLDLLRPPLQQLNSTGKVVQVLISHTWNDASITDVDEYVALLLHCRFTSTVNI